jgi:hypothetical protein
VRITLNAILDALDDDYEVKWHDFFVYRKREPKSGRGRGKSSRRTGKSMDLSEFRRK